MPDSLKESLFVGCAEKACCSYYSVYPTGHDVWRIATALQVEPWAFCASDPTDDDDPDGFVLGPGGPRARITLRRTPAADGTPGACTFLVRLPDGAARCGLGQGRPIGCRCFPCVLDEGLVQIRSDDVCTCRAWSLADVDPARERALLDDELDQQDTFREVLANWNAFAVTLPEPASFEDLCRFVLDIYGGMAAAV